MNSPKVYPVSFINLYVKRKLQTDPFLSDVYIRGEISNFKRHSSGHLYLSLKDESGAIAAVMFASDARGLRFFPANGDQVIAGGSVSLYEKTGQYQFYIRSMEKEGSGDLYQAFLRMKEKLEREGLFDPARKKKIPAFPKKIGIVTSPTGAALRDICQIARRRYPGVSLVVAPALVQGAGAAETIVRGIRRLDRMEEIETILVCRGGGSIEDLWPFNEEIVARAIAQAQTPIISGVGHETDFTIADFAADLRAPTPSAAAELSVPDVSGLLDQVGIGAERRKRALYNTLQLFSSKLTHLSSMLQWLSPTEKLKDHRIELDRMSEKLDLLIVQKKAALEERLTRLSQALLLDSPMHQMEKGYAFITDASGTGISSARRIRTGEEIFVRMMDGELGARVETIRIDEDETDHE